MYGLTSSAATASGTGAGVLAATGGTLWMFFAGVTVIFAGAALVQLVRRPGTHRP